MQKNKIQDAIFGLVVGDALGVPVEFKSRDEIATHPVEDMRGYGTYYLPAGTWSDDSSLTFCLAEALMKPLIVSELSFIFQKWLFHNYWTPHGDVFDVGIATRRAIERMAQGIHPEQAGGNTETANGNGSLMRLLPLLFYIKDKPMEERFEWTKVVSSLTHRHIRSVIACFYYLEFARGLYANKDPFLVYETLKETVPRFLRTQSVPLNEITVFNRLLTMDIQLLSVSDIQSSGYVVHTLEASIWCLLKTTSYKDAVLKAVNLGEDTDTTAAVTGGLAGLRYGFSSIPAHWVNQLARKKDIEDLVHRLLLAYPTHTLQEDN